MIEPIRSEIRWMVAHGAPLEEIEAKIIDSAPYLSEDQRASMWLYAWGSVERRERGQTRHEDHIAEFVG
jgi:hypothetical protein